MCLKQKPVVETTGYSYTVPSGLHLGHYLRVQRDLFEDRAYLQAVKQLAFEDAGLSPSVNVPRDTRGIAAGVAGRFGDLLDHFLEGVDIIVIENNARCEDLGYVAHRGIVDLRRIYRR
jgi:hypothetical protein